MKPIPGTQGFMASEDGVIYDPDGIERNTYNNTDGYITASVKLDDGSWVTFGVQRLVALAHLDCPGVPSEFVVNHIDLNIENNHKSNLEWLTVAQNNTHAALFGLEGRRARIRATKTSGNGITFSVSANSMEKMSELVFIDKFDIWKSIKDSTPVDGWEFKHIRSKDKKPVYLHLDTQFKKGVSRDSDFYLKKPVWIKDLDTDEISAFESVTAAARIHGVPCNHINFAICKEEVPRLFKKHFMISDTGDFPELTAEEIEKRKASGGRVVVGYDLDSKTLVTSTSAASFVKQYGLSKKAITTTLKDNLLKVKQGWLFVYDTPENRERLFEEIKRLTGSVQTES